ncbi:MAG: amidase, partial [Gammaproteobacteria bacterium]|nr:amidase [Gammaproteobacteria bacterium]
MPVNLFAPIDSLIKEANAEPQKAQLLRYQAYDNQQQTQPLYQAYRETRPPTTNDYSGLLNGISVSVKDLYGVAGLQTYAGTAYTFDNCISNGPLVQALVDQGAYIIGKTHTVEFAFGGLGTNPHWPIPYNPWDKQQHRVPGGSSAGAPVSLLTHSCQLALGTDTSGSVRVPAAMCGTFGIKTSTGRWDKQNIVPLSPSIDSAGLLARTAADALWGFAVMDPVSCDDPQALITQLQQPLSSNLQGIRIGYIPDYFADCEDGIDNVVMAALAQLSKAGATLVELAWPGLEESWQL